MLIKIISLLSFLSLFLSSVPAYSAVFNISSGDVAGLIGAINTANSNGEENTINLAPGTYTLTSVDNNGPPFGGPNGLPGITGAMTINGESAETTIIERNPAAPRFRIFAVASGGKLTLSKLTISGGWANSGAGIRNEGTLTITDSIIDRNGDSVTFPGGGIDNRGTLTILRSIITNNLAIFDGGGIFNSGTATIMRSTIAHNFSEGAGGVQNGTGFIPAGTVTIQNSTIRNNGGDGSGVIANGRMGIMTITNSSIASNITRFPLSFGGPGGISNSGALHINNSTVAGNRAGVDLGPRVLSGIENSGVLELQNTIVDQCSGPITSRGNNIVADLSNCGITLLSSDLTGDPGLGAFIDDGAPGHGRFPLLETSQAIDRGNNDDCSSDPALATDQLGKPRSVAGTVDGARVCDIGAVEFFPVVNELVRLREGELTTEFDSTPSLEAPAGTFVITAPFENISNETIFFPFFEVATLELQSTVEVPPEVKCPGVGFAPAPAEDQPLLLNADGGPGRPQCVSDFPRGPVRLLGAAGARITPQDSLTRPFEPGATGTFQFRIGLQKQEPFTFFVNMLGERRTSNTSLSMAGEFQTSNR